MSKPPRLSGLAREVLSLYRSCLREANKKPADAQPPFRNYINREFRKHATEVSKKDFATIELLLRRGRRQMEVYSNPGVMRLSIAGG